MMRDNNKSEIFFKNRLSNLDDYLKYCETADTEFTEEQISSLRHHNIGTLLTIIRLHYSMGTELIQIQPKVVNIINLLIESWKCKHSNYNYGRKRLDQFTMSSYEQILTIVSLGYLLNVKVEVYNQIIEILEKCKINDFLLDFIISANNNRSSKLKKENYFHKILHIQKKYKYLKLAIQEKDRLKAQDLVKTFVTREWYKHSRSAGWWNSHKKDDEISIYSGYWSFETAAVVKIMGLDNSFYKDCKYYPIDIVNFDIKS